MDTKKISGKSVTVKYLEDNIVHQCDIKCVKNVRIEPGDFRRVKWKDGHYYKAKILKTDAFPDISVQFVADRVMYKTNFSSVDNCFLQKGDERLVKYTDNRFYKARILKIGNKEKIIENIMPPSISNLDLSHQQSLEVENDDVLAIENLELHIGTEQLPSAQPSTCDVGNKEKIIENIMPPSISNLGPSHQQSLEVENDDVLAIENVELHIGTGQLPSAQPSTCDVDLYEGTLKMPSRKRTTIRRYSNSSLSDTESSLFSSDGATSWHPSASDYDSPSEDENDALKGRRLKGDTNLQKSTLKEKSSSCSSLSKYQSLNNDNIVEEKKESFEVSRGNPVKTPIPNLISKEQSQKDGDKEDFGKEDKQTSACSTDISSSSNSKKVLVKQVDKSKDIRIWDKKDACFFCYKLFASLRQHLLISHSTEPDVLDCFASPKNSIERGDKIRRLRNRGNYLHNTKVLEQQRGDLLVCRRPSKMTSPEKFLPCPHCLGFFLGKKLFRHARNCPDFSGDNCSNMKIKTYAKLLVPSSKVARTDFEEKVLSRMRNDEITHFVKCDQQLLAFGAKLIDKFHNEPHMVYEISNKLRTLAKFTLSLKQKHPSLGSVQDLILPEAFPLVIEEVKSQYLRCKKPSPTTAIKIGHNLKHCANIAMVGAIVKSDRCLREKLQDFLILYKENYLPSISTVAKSMIHEERFNKPIGIPEEDDLIKFNEYIITEEKKFITNGFENASYSEVLKITLTHVISFNRRRVGEVQRLEVSKFLNRNKCSTPIGTVEKMLTEADKKRNSNLQKIEVKGKKGTKSPLLFTENMVTCIDYILKVRNESGVPSQNPYVFACPYGKFFYRGTDVIKSVAVASGVKNLKFINSRGLRKHLATITQLFNLKQNERDSLIDYMGHSAEVHKDYYQMPDDIMQKTQISRIFFLLETGKAREFAGKALADMDDLGQNETEEEDSEAENNDNTFHDVCRSVEIHKDDRFYGPQTSGSVARSQEVAVRPLKRKGQEMVETHRRKTMRENEDKSVFTSEEKQIIFSYFKQFTMMLKPPGAGPCRAFQEKYPAFKKYKWEKIKWAVYNQWSRKKLQKE